MKFSEMYVFINFDKIQVKFLKNLEDYFWSSTGSYVLFTCGSSYPFQQNIIEKNTFLGKNIFILITKSKMLFVDNVDILPFGTIKPGRKVCK